MFLSAVQLFSFAKLVKEQFCKTYNAVQTMINNCYYGSNQETVIFLLCKCHNIEGKNLEFALIFVSLILL